MVTQSELDYRARLAEEYRQPAIFDALETILPSDPSNDSPATSLIRQLYFSPSEVGYTPRPAFADQVPDMATHGVRQVALAKAVFEQDDVAELTPPWLKDNMQTFLGGIMVADVGLTHVPADEIELVNAKGPRYMEEYFRHPEFGFEMSRNIIEENGTSNDRASRMIAYFIGRHHSTQARRQYGLEWHEMVMQGYRPDAKPSYARGRATAEEEAETDLMVAFAKPGDYFDDTIARTDKTLSFEERVQLPVGKYVTFISNMLVNNLCLAGHSFIREYHPGLFNRVARGVTQQVITNPELRSIYEQELAEHVTV